MCGARYNPSEVNLTACIRSGGNRHSNGKLFKMRRDIPLSASRQGDNRQRPPQSGCRAMPGRGSSSRPRIWIGQKKYDWSKPAALHCLAVQLALPWIGGSVIVVNPNFWILSNFESSRKQDNNEGIEQPGLTSCLVLLFCFFVLIEEKVAELQKRYKRNYNVGQSTLTTKNWRQGSHTGSHQ